MVKCPKCKAEIQELNVTFIDTGKLYLNEQGKIVWNMASDTFGPNLRFSCPKCNKILFSSQEDAVLFLMGSRKVMEK